MIMDWNLEDFTNTIFGTFESPDGLYVKLVSVDCPNPEPEEALTKVI